MLGKLAAVIIHIAHVGLDTHGLQHSVELLHIVVAAAVANEQDIQNTVLCRVGLLINVFHRYLRCVSGISGVAAGRKQDCRGEQ